MHCELLCGALSGRQLGLLLAGGRRSIVFTLLVLLAEDLTSPQRLLALRRCGRLLSSHSGSNRAVRLAGCNRSICDYWASLWHTCVALILGGLRLQVRRRSVVEQPHGPDTWLS